MEGSACVETTPIKDEGLHIESGDNICSSNSSAASNLENKDQNAYNQQGTPSTISLNSSGFGAPSSESKSDAKKDAIGKMSLRMEIMLRKEKKKKEEESQFTYKPKFYTNKKRGKDIETQEDEGGRFSRLYKDALNRHLTQQLKEEAASKENPFAPALISSPVSRSRSQSRDRSSPKSSRASTPTKYEDPDLTFKPVIFTKKGPSSASKSLTRTPSETELAIRLYNYDKRYKDKVEAKRSEREEKENAACTFSPDLSKTKRRHSLSTSTVPVEERMVNYEVMKKKHVEDRRKAREEKDTHGLTFKPTLITKNNQRPSTPEAERPVYERLSMSMEKPLSPAVREHLAEYTYKPHLFTAAGRSNSPQGETISAYATTNDRLYYTGLERRTTLDHEAEQRRLEKEVEGLTLKPSISAYRISLDQSGYVEENVFDRLATTPTASLRASTPNNASFRRDSGSLRSSKDDNQDATTTGSNSLPRSRSSGGTGRFFNSSVGPNRDLSKSMSMDYDAVPVVGEIDLSLPVEGEQGGEEEEQEQDECFEGISEGKEGGNAAMMVEEEEGEAAVAEVQQH